MLDVSNLDDLPPSASGHGDDSSWRRPWEFLTLCRQNTNTLSTPSTTAAMGPERVVAASSFARRRPPSPPASPARFSFTTLCLLVAGRQQHFTCTSSSSYSVSLLVQPSTIGFTRASQPSPTKAHPFFPFLSNASVSPPFSMRPSSATTLALVLCASSTVLASSPAPEGGSIQALLNRYSAKSHKGVPVDTIPDALKPDQPHHNTTIVVVPIVPKNESVVANPKGELSLLTSAVLGRMADGYSSPAQLHPQPSSSSAPSLRRMSR